MPKSLRNLKLIAYALLGSGVVGIGASILMNLDRLIVLPFFPDVLDAICIITAGILLLREMFLEATRVQARMQPSELGK